MFLLLILNISQPFSSVSIVDFEQVNVSWVNAWYVDEEEPSSIFKTEAAQEKMFIVFNLQTAIT